MQKGKRLIISFLSFLLGFILNGLAWTVLPGPEYKYNFIDCRIYTNVLWVHNVRYKLF